MLQRPGKVRITVPELQVDIKREIAQAWHMRTPGGVQSLPAPNPVPLRRKQLDLLAKESYVVAEKSDGVRYLLLLSRFASGPEKGREFAVMIDRTMEMFQVPVVANECFFNGTIFDGELVEERTETETEMETEVETEAEAGKRRQRQRQRQRPQRQLKYLCFDVVRHCGNSTLQIADFSQRHRIVSQSFAQMDDPERDPDVLAQQGKVAMAMVPGKTNIRGCVKNFVDTRFLPSLVRESAHERGHDSDGFIFMPVHEGIGTGTQRSMFKWKYAPSIDVLYRDGEYYCLEDAELYPLSASEFQFVLKKHVRTNNNNNNVILEFEVRKSDKSGEGNERGECKPCEPFVCTLHKIRTDKSQPNQLSTIRAIEQELTDAITLQELQEICTQ